MQIKYNKLAAKKYRKAVWVIGNGKYALLAHCNNNLSVSLHSRISDAYKSKNQIDKSGCGGMCINNHEIINLDTDKKELCK